LRAALAVEDQLFRAIAVLRVVVLAYALLGNLVRGVDEFDRPGWGYAMLAVMVAWTAFATWAYADPVRRGAALLVADLAVTLALLVATPLVKSPDFDASVPGFWVMAVLLAWAVRWRWVGGLVAGVVLGAVDIAVRSDPDATDLGNVFLLLIGGPIVGFMCGSLQQMAAERDRAERSAAAAAERARLARVVHDGVLQVLALVQRRGAELGGVAADLGRLAGEQEVALRSLIRAQDNVRPDAPGGTVDVADGLARLGLRPGVDVAVPGGAVELPATVAEEVVAVVTACLDNVTRHVGEGASAWVLLEAFPDRVEVSVRDEGPGIPDGRLEAAAAEGRLGVSESIRGRVADLGGEARLTTGSFGTEWELVVPRDGAGSGTGDGARDGSGRDGSGRA
jgi:signal transduction histidine kinase